MAKKAKKKYELAVPQWAKPAVKFIKKSTEPIVNAVMNSPQVKIIVNAVPKVVSPPPKSKRGESKKLPVTPKTVQPAKSAPVKKKNSPKREAKGTAWRNIKPADSGNAAQVNLQNKENSNNIKLSWEETVQMYVDDIRKGETHSGALRTLTLTSDPILSQLNNALNLSKIISSVADVSGVKGYYNKKVKSVEESFNDIGNQVYNSKIPFASNFVGAFTNSSDYRKNGPLPLETEAENKLLAGLNYLYFSKFGGGILNHADPLTTYNSIKDNTNMASVIGANMGGAFINGGAKMADGMANMCLDPYGTIEGMLHMASNPKETLQSVSKSIETFSFHMVNADSQEKARLQGTLLFDVASIVMLSKLGKGAEGAKEAQGANEAGGLVKRGVSINKTEAEMANASRGAGGPGVAEGTGKIKYDINGKYTGGRTQNELNALEYDPAKKAITNGSKNEAKIGLDLEEKGIIGQLERSPDPKAEFIDSITGKKYDVKSFESTPMGSDGVPITSPRKGAFKAENAMKNIVKEFERNGNDIVIIDKSKLLPEHVNELTNAIEGAGLSDKIIWWPE